LILCDYCHVQVKSFLHLFFSVCYTVIMSLTDVLLHEWCEENQFPDESEQFHRIARNFSQENAEELTPERITSLFRDFLLAPCLHLFQELDRLPEINEFRPRLQSILQNPKSVHDFLGWASLPEVEGWEEVMRRLEEARWQVSDEDGEE